MFLLLFPTVLGYFIVCFYFVLEIEFTPGFLASALLKNLLELNVHNSAVAGPQPG